MPTGEGLQGTGHYRHAHPQRLAGRDAAGKGKGIQRHVHMLIRRQILRMRSRRQQLQPLRPTSRAINRSRYRRRTAGSPNPRYFKTNREVGTRRRISAQTATTSGVIFARLLKLPKVVYPCFNDGGGPTGGAASGGS